MDFYKVQKELKSHSFLRLDKLGIFPKNFNVFFKTSQVDLSVGSVANIYYGSKISQYWST